MAKLAIKGHATRGKEVIELLEMLGGENKYHINFTEENLLYTIREGDNAIIATYPNSSINKIFTLEEFLEKFPYKVGDEVSSTYLKNYKIEKMRWKDTYNRVTYKLQGVGWFSADVLRPCKEENSNFILTGKINTVIFQEQNYEDKVELDLGDNYEIKVEDGKTYAVRKQLQYPKNYKDCCDALGLCTMDNDAKGYKSLLIIQFQELLIARDVYWKIAGEQMGLGKPWEPEFRFGKKKYSIMTKDNKVISATVEETNRILVFPTEEMRDVFLENFRDKIERCKEFL